MEVLMKNINKSQLYKHYFLALKGYYCLMGLVSLYLADFSVVGVFLTAFALCVLALQFFGAMKAQEWLENKELIGFLLSFGLTVLALPGYSFPIGVFGLYALLNKEFRETQLPKELPQWLEDLFKKLDQKVPRTF
jgi:hypothetical protein